MKQYTFVWEIENYSYCWHKEGSYLLSPNFTIVDKSERTTWRLELYPRGMYSEDRMLAICLKRDEQDDGPRYIFLTGELTVLGVDDLSFYDNTISRRLLKGGGLIFQEVLHIEDVLDDDGTESEWVLPQDILRVCCKLWVNEGNVCSVGQSSARTRIKIEKNSFLHVVENFSKLQPYVVQTITIQSHSRKKFFITSRFYFTTDDIMMIEIVLSDANLILSKCKLSLVDSSGNVLICGCFDNRADALKTRIHRIPLSLSRNEILKKKSVYLPDDKLSLMFECIFPSGSDKLIEESLDEIPSALVKKKNDYVPTNNVYEAAQELSICPSILEDMKSLYINQCLTDVEVKSQTKSYPAHKTILCARSPVFLAMFSNEMKEKQTRCIYMDDLEDDVVQKLLFFLYSDNIEDIDWEAANKLYYAADKYQVDKLKKVCSVFLLENLATNNASDVLFLADTHNDSDLKSKVVDFILQHEEQVYGSKGWEELMEKNPLLVSKTMHLKYKKK